MAILIKPEWKKSPSDGSVRGLSIGNRNLREGPGLKYPVIGKLSDGAVVALTQYNTWENPVAWQAGTPDRHWSLVLDLADKPLGWVCGMESVTKTGKISDLIDRVFLVWLKDPKNPPSPQYYLDCVKELEEATKKFNAVVNAKKATGAKIPAEREPLPDSGDAPSSMAAPLAIGALAILAWKFWPK